MSECVLAGCGWVLAVSSWVQPQPKLSAGLLVNYGDQSYLESMAEFHGYTLAGYKRGPDGPCAIASISPAHLGRIAWVWVDGAQPFGPCLVVDVMARHHAYRGIYLLGEVAEVPRWLAEWFGFSNGEQGYVYFDDCPPPTEDWLAPRRYQPPLRFDNGGERHPSFYPYPEQQLPVKCERMHLQ